MADNDFTAVVDVKPASTATRPHPATPPQADAESLDTQIKQDPDTILSASVPLTPSTRKRPAQPLHTLRDSSPLFSDSGLPTPPPLHGTALIDDVPISSTASTAPCPGEARPQSSRTAVHSTDTGEPDDAPSTSRSNSQGASSSFTAFRSPAAPSGSQPAADNEPLPRPAKRERRAPPPRCDILPQPAHPPQLDRTPDNYWNHMMPHHPWARYITPLPEWTGLSNDNVTSALPKNVYAHLGNGGYLGTRFVKSLFPRKFRGVPSADSKLPIMELMRMEHAIDFRRHASNLIEEVLHRRYMPVDPHLPPASAGVPPSLVYPPRWKQRFPVLYQVVAKNREQHSWIRLEAALRQGLLMGLLSQTHPQCVQRSFEFPPPIPLLPYNGDGHQDTLFLRVNEFVFVTPPSANKLVLGIVLSAPRRGDGEVNNLKIAFEGCPEAVTVSPIICDFPLTEIEVDDFVLAETRINVSCAMRFSEPPISRDAQSELIDLARQFLPAYPADGILPLRVSKLDREDTEWIEDRGNSFTSYTADPRSARKRMGQLFSAACSALAANALIGDDKSTHHEMATVPSLTAFPLRLEFRLSEMTSDNKHDFRSLRVLSTCNSKPRSHVTVPSNEPSNDTAGLTGIAAL
ncbi:hypothetical protein ANCCAN_03095 [Ancylostoma caninum]|uniref:Uncharacterized protein n=1 Tax=Ancylostoma caninum TaxID=29170 RepID=A0A368H6J6_ANCCA|nr:hypothetical protein ANCCAN_03095 [Ancylostoma caninum]